jgi:hypothetical protein
MMTVASLVVAAGLFGSPGAAAQQEVVVQDTSEAVTRDGVTLPQRIEVEGHQLRLNGAATRKKFIVKVCGYMEDIEKGQQFVFSYLPGQGTRVNVKGVTKGTIEGKAFADALFKAWIGPKPGPGEGFKKRLLGG